MSQASKICDTLEKIAFSYRSGLPASVPNSSFLYPHEIRDYARLLERLMDKQRKGVYKRLWECLSQELKNKIIDWRDKKPVPDQGFKNKIDKEDKQPVPEELEGLFLKELDGILGLPNFFREEAFKGVSRSPQTQALLSRGITCLSKENLRRFNRLLLGEALPEEIISHPIPQLVSVGPQVIDTQNVWANGHYPFIYQHRDEAEAFVGVLERLGLRGTALEIGLENGGTHLLFREIFQRVISIEVSLPKIMDFVNRVKLDHRSLIINGNSTHRQTIEIIEDYCPQVDLLFIDGDHSYAGIYTDYMLYRDLVREGGVIALHDTAGRAPEHRDVQVFLTQLRKGQIDGIPHTVADIIRSGTGISYEVKTKSEVQHKDTIILPQETECRDNVLTVLQQKLESRNERIKILEKELRALSEIKLRDSLISSGTYGQAIAFFNKAIDIDPNDKWAWNGKGAALSGLKRYTEAIDCFNKAIDIDLSDTGAWNSKGTALSGLKRHTEAIDCFNKAIDIDLGNTGAWNGKGIALNGLKRYTEAIDCFNKAIDIDLSDTEAWNGKGAALNRLKRYMEAIDCFNKAVDTDPTYTEAWNGKGAALSGLKRYTEAIDCFNNAVDTDPTYTEAWNGKGTALNGLKRYTEAIDCFNNIIEKIDSRHKEAWIDKGTSLNGLKRYAEAIECFDKVIAIDPTRKEALEGKAIALDGLESSSRPKEIERQYK